MKRKSISRWGIALVMTMLLSCFALPVFAAQTCTLSMDGVPVPTKSYTSDGPFGGTSGKYYMDVLPEIKNSRTYVPISTITKFLGATIDWQSPTVTISYNKTKLILNIGESTALQNGETLLLDAAPYLSHGRTMVPLRFISESLGCNVNYKNNNVAITFPTLKIDHVPVTAVQYEYWMTLGSVISESKNNICISRLYNALKSATSHQIAAPTNFSTLVNLDVESFYYKFNELTFKDQNDTTIAQYELYYEFSFGMTTGVCALRDAKNDIWYSLTSKQFNELIDLQNLGAWHEISNTVV